MQKIVNKTNTLQFKKIKYIYNANKLRNVTVKIIH